MHAGRDVGRKGRGVQVFVFRVKEGVVRRGAAGRPNTNGLDLAAVDRRQKLESRNAAWTEQGEGKAWAVQTRRGEETERNNVDEEKGRKVVYLPPFRLSLVC